MVLTYNNYLRKSIPMKYQKSKAKIRLSSLNLSIETGRYSNPSKASRCCFHVLTVLKMSITSY